MKNMLLVAVGLVLSTTQSLAEMVQQRVRPSEWAAELGTSIGLSETDIRDALEKRTFKNAVDEDWNRSYQKGVTAVPTFIMNGMSLVGAQPYDKLVQLMEAAGVNKRV